MIVENWRGYREGADLSKIPKDFLAFPSQNVLVTKGKVVLRGGLVNDGTATTVEEPIHSEFVWKDAIGGTRFIRVHGQTVQVKVGENWHTIFTALDSDVARVFFASWTDGNGSVIKKRLVMCDGSTSLYQWNGFVGTVDSFSTPTITFEADKATLGLMGADDGSGTTQTVIVYDMNAGAIDAQEEEPYTSDPTGGLTMTLDSAPTSFTVASGDIVIAKPVAFADAISSTFGIDTVYSFQNHLIVANYGLVDLHFSHRETYSLSTGFNFVQPSAGSRTSITPIHLYLDANFTAMQSRKNVLWVSDSDDWYKVTKTIEQNSYDLWTDVEKFEGGELKGALPMAVAKHKGDIIYVAQDKTLQRITTIDILSKDDILLLSNDVEGMFNRLDWGDVRLTYSERGIFLVLPLESKLLVLDTADENWFFQPPQTIPINCLSIFNGIKYGHHNAQNETYELFSGRNDLDAERAEAKIAVGYSHGGHHFRFKRHGVIGIDCRLTDSCSITWERFFEEDGTKALATSVVAGTDVEKFGSEVDGSWASYPYASLPYGGNDDSNDVYRAFIFNRDRVDGYFEYRPIITVSGTEAEFHLLALYWEDAPSPRKISSNLFVAKE